MKAEHTARVNDRWWLVQFGGDPRSKDAMGLCYNDFEVIRIDDKLKGADLLSTLCHEFTHAVAPYLTEEAVCTIEAAMTEAQRVYRERQGVLRAKKRAETVPSKGKRPGPVKKR